MRDSLYLPKDLANEGWPSMSSFECVGNYRNECTCPRCVIYTYAKEGCNGDDRGGALFV